MRSRITALSGLTAATLLLPALASAQVQASGIFRLLNTATQILNILLSIFVLLAVVVFFWGLIQYLVNVGEDKSKGLHTMIWGIIAIFVMVSIWGIIHILQATIGVNSATDTSLTPNIVVPKF